MGFTGLARWINAPTSGLELINENIMRNHGGTFRSKWSLSVKSYRSIANASNGNGAARYGMPGDRTMCTVIMNEHAFVLLEDPAAPTRAESLMAAQQSQRTAGTQDTASTVPPEYLPPHYRTTFLTVSPPQSLELLLAQLKARWQPVRQTGGPARGPSNLAGGAQLAIEGNVFAIGSDWLVRAGNVVLTGGTVKGMLLEAEYLPLQVMPVQSADGIPELLSNLLTSLLPPVPDAKTGAVTMPEGQWDEILYSGEDADAHLVGNVVSHGQEDEEEVVDDLYVYGVPPSRKKKDDWQGIDRDRRAAFLIIGGLRSEGVL